MKLDAKRLRLYAVTDRAWTDGTDGLLRQVAEAIDGGAGMVQLREKHLGQADFLAEAERFVALCREKGAVSIINDNVEIAAQVGADGVQSRGQAVLGRQCHKSTPWLTDRHGYDRPWGEGRRQHHQRQCGDRRPSGS